MNDCRDICYFLVVVVDDEYAVYVDAAVDSHGVVALLMTARSTAATAA